MDHDAPKPGGLSRRGLLGRAAAGFIAAVGARALYAAEAGGGPAITKGRIKQSACRWCYGKVKLDELCVAAKRIGLVGLDLIGPGDFETLKQHGLVATMVSAGNIANGFNRKENHAKLIDELRSRIDAASAYGYANVICFSGNRAGLADDEGMKTCAEGLKQIVGYAEEKKVTICMELLNSKRNHKDYMCDRTKWGADLCKLVGSERFKLLYDIYHMQIDEGDVIATIREFKDYIGHYHTGGVPGRNEIDESQELFYPSIVKAIIDTGFQGYMAHEFIPRNPQPLASLEAAAKLCDV